MTASTRYCTPLFLKAEPPTTGTNLLAIVWRRMPAFSICWRDRLLLEERLADFVVEIADRLDQIVVGLVDHAPCALPECPRTS